MIYKRWITEIAQRKLIISIAELLHLDISTIRSTKSGSKCNFRCPWGLISCWEDTHPLRSMMIEVPTCTRRGYASTNADIPLSLRLRGPGGSNPIPSLRWGTGSYPQEEQHSAISNQPWARMPTISSQRGCVIRANPFVDFESTNYFLFYITSEYIDQDYFLEKRWSLGANILSSYCIEVNNYIY